LNSDKDRFDASACNAGDASLWSWLAVKRVPKLLRPESFFSLMPLIPSYW
jgi:hypothetical protein